ncbi:MAG: hypothetical protein E7168_04050 [Firmicutes bacterium]|nr:hypothetical protein [Bacillota bacterium]
MNNREWTDWNLSNPREEWGQVENPPTNNSSSYYNSEHWYNEHDDTTLGYDMPSLNSGYKSSENYYNEGIVFGIGPNINGKTPSELITSGLLTSDTITLEDKQVIYEDIMLGLTNNKDMLAKKIDLIISDKNIINNIISNQYMLSVQEMKKEEKDFVENAPINRKFQFLLTVKILLEKGYDINSLSFKKGESQISLAKLVSDFRKKCIEHRAKNIGFKFNQAQENYNPWLLSGTLITEIYINNIQMFEAEYENYKQTTKMPPEQILSYEEFIHYAYGIEIPVKTDNLEHFKEARERQMQQDQLLKEQQLVSLTQETVETKEGHNLK